MSFGIGEMARGGRDGLRVRRSQDHEPVNVSRRLTQHLRRLDEHRHRIEHVERIVDDVSTELGQLADRLAAAERRIVELHVAAVGCRSDDASDCSSREPLNH